MNNNKFKKWIKKVLLNLLSDYKTNSKTDRPSFYNNIAKTGIGSDKYIVELGKFEAKQIEKFYYEFIKKLENEVQNNPKIFDYFDLKIVCLEFEKTFYKLFLDSKSHIERESIIYSIFKDITESSISKIQISHNDCFGKIKSKLEEISLKLSMNKNENIEEDKADDILLEKSDEEIELCILLECITQYKKAKANKNLKNNKCAREIDISKVLKKITREGEYRIDYWLNRLAPDKKPKRGPLRRCSNSILNENKHRYHVRAFESSSNKEFISAWERIKELKKQIGFSSDGILYKSSLQEIDFKQWMMNEEENKQIAFLYIDIDDFKELNKEYTETLVDKTILPDFIKLLKKITNDNGKAYREHERGDEFVVILPNQNQSSAKKFAEKLRSIVQSTIFNIIKEEKTKEEKITVSIGVALWPDHGREFDEIKMAANKAKQNAKDTGKNKVIMANSKYI